MFLKCMKTSPSEKAEDEEEETDLLLTSQEDCSSQEWLMQNTLEFAKNDEDEENSKQPPIPRTPFFIYVITFFSSIGGFLFGYNTAVIAGALLELDKDYHLDSTQKELVVSVTLMAAALGAIAGGALSEKLGRKRTIMTASLVFTVGAVAMAAAPLSSWGWTVVLTGRFIVGVGIGLASLTEPVYLAECAPAHLRGRLNIANTVVVSGGQLAAAIIAYSFSYLAQGWRYMLGVGAIPAIVCFSVFFFLPESPRWLVGRGRRESARAVLRKVRAGRMEDVDSELTEIQKDLDQSAEKNRQGVLRKLKTVLTTRHLFLALTIGCGLHAIQQFSGINAVIYYSPTILRMAGVVSEHTAIGLSVVIPFLNTALQPIGIYLVEKTGRRSLILSSLVGVVISLFVLGCIFYLANVTSSKAYAPAAAAQINGSSQPESGCYSYTSCTTWRNCDDCVISDDCHYCTYSGSSEGRNTIGLCVSQNDPELSHEGMCVAPDSQTLTYTSSSGSGECLSMDIGNATVKTFEYCPSDYAWLIMAALVMYTVAFSPGVGPIPWTVNAEIYPNWARSVGSSVATTTNWVTNLLVSVTFLHATQYFTRYGVFWLYTALSTSGWVFIFLLLPETKGKPLEKVEELLQRPLCPPPGFGSDGKWCSRRTYLRLRHRQHEQEKEEPIPGMADDI